MLLCHRNGGGISFTTVPVHAISSSTVILVPTVQLLSQWYALLAKAFQMEIGLYFRGEKCVRSLTLTLYDAARDLMANHGNTFEMLICDEIQHVPIQTLREAVCMTPAPFLLGLALTSPEEREQRDEGWQIDDLIGPAVYTLCLEILTEEQRVAYRTQRVLVDLTDFDANQCFSASKNAMNSGSVIVNSRGSPGGHVPSPLCDVPRVGSVQTHL
jgi:superfamily II DNA or RNA helicase